MTAAPLSAETIKKFLYASTATVSMQMMKRGFRNCAINGMKPLNAKATRLVGPAYTLRYIPGREDLDKPPTPADPPSAQREAIEETPAGHVLVIATEGNTRSAPWATSWRCASRCAAWRACERRRDARHAGDRQVRLAGLLQRRRRAAQHGQPASRRGADAGRHLRRAGLSRRRVVADEDGAIVVPRHLADEVARDSFEQERLEKFVAIRVGQGKPITGVYPPNDETKAHYAAWIKAGEPPNGYRGPASRWRSGSGALAFTVWMAMLLRTSRTIGRFRACRPEIAGSGRDRGRRFRGR